ncbi:hypothetical protein Tco_1222249, partial [Tanacetum coccineum]
GLGLGFGIGNGVSRGLPRRRLRGMPSERRWLRVCWVSVGGFIAGIDYGGGDDDDDVSDGGELVKGVFVLAYFLWSRLHK